MALPRRRLPCALTIAGSDSGGGAGIQADLKTFAALGVHGACAITCLTAQNPIEVRSIHAATPAMVRDQIRAVFDELRPAAIKTGMLHSPPIIRAVGRAMCAYADVPWVVDPVMASTGGACLLEADALQLFISQVLKRARLVTPNLDEAERLLRRRLRTLQDLHIAARELHHRFGPAFLVKGGHLRNSRTADDVFFDGCNELLLQAPRVRNVSTHGTGCTYSAAIAAYLARGETLHRAVVQAKKYISNAIASSVLVAGHEVLGF